MTIKFNNNLPIVCIQGLGFVGAAMAVAVATSKNSKNKPIFNVVGVDLQTQIGIHRVNSLNNGEFPFQTTDKKLINELKKAIVSGNLVATTDENVFKLADITLVSVNLDIELNGKQTLNLDGFRKAINTLGKLMPSGSLVIIETTVPPGTCEKIAAPELAKALEERNLPSESILLSYSYERIMPGKDYLDSIINYWRVYAGYTEEAADRCKEFLSKIINVDKYPLTILKSTTACEIGKVLENSYRAINIAFMEEWGRFAEDVGVDLFEVINAIRVRPTHSNIRQPGFGIGGYCLTKDPLMAKISSRELFSLSGHDFPFCSMAVKLNKKMPLVSLEKIKAQFDDDISGRKILLLGISYRQDVGDTRYSPSETFVKAALKCGAEVISHDPLVDYWPELDMKINRTLPNPDEFDVIIFAVQHKEYINLDIKTWLGDSNPLIFDANNVLTSSQLDSLKAANFNVLSIGRG